MDTAFAMGETDRNHELAEAAERAKKGGAPKYHEKLAQQG